MSRFPDFIKDPLNGHGPPPPPPPNPPDHSVVKGFELCRDHVELMLIREGYPELARRVSRLSLQRTK